MEELPLNLTPHDEPELVLLDEQTASAAGEEYAKLRMALTTLFQGLKAGSLTEGYKKTLLSCSETYLKTLLDKLGYQGQLAADETERHARVRQVNEQNRALRAQLGQKVSAEDVREHLKLLTEQVRSWWASIGFGYVAETTFDQYGAELTFSLTSFEGDHYYGEGPRPDGRAQLAEFGFAFTAPEHPRRARLLDTDRNRALLLAVLAARFPTGSPGKLENRFRREEMGFILECITLRVPNLSDLETPADEQ